MAHDVQGKAIVSAYVDTEVRYELLRLARAGERSLSAEARRAVVTHVNASRDRAGKSMAGEVGVPGPDASTNPDTNHEEQR